MHLCGNSDAPAGIGYFGDFSAQFWENPKKYIIFFFKIEGFSAILRLLHEINARKKLRGIPYSKNMAKFEAGTFCQA